MTVSNACASESAPEPRAIARSMLSFGMEYERAFSIAFCSARLPEGSGPPSFAATMIARESLENSLPRLASAAPFLCLIEDHLLCPDIDPPVPSPRVRRGTSRFPRDPLPWSADADRRLRRLSYGIQEQLVYSRIVGQLGVKGCHEDTPVAYEHRLALVLGQDLHVSGHTHARRTDEDAAQRGALSR